jgi:predicted RNA-binding protein with PIN domain
MPPLPFRATQPSPSPPASEAPPCVSLSSVSAPPSSDASAAPVVLPAARVWLVDGFNAIHTVLLGGQSREQWWTEPVRTQLLERVRRFQAAETEVWVVFDGSRPPDSGTDVLPTREGPVVHTVFAPSADAWLVDRARRSDEPGSLAVVTADRKVAGRCRHAGAAVISPRDFLALCPGDDQQTE